MLCIRIWTCVRAVLRKYSMIQVPTLAAFLNVGSQSQKNLNALRVASLSAKNAMQRVLIH